MKQNVIPRNEWDFSSVKSRELRRCVAYESARSSEKLKTLHARATQNRGRLRDKLTLAKFGRFGRIDEDGDWDLSGLGYLIPAGYPDVCFMDLPPQKPVHLSAGAVALLEQLMKDKRTIPSTPIAREKGYKKGQEGRVLRTILMGIGYLRLQEKLNKRKRTSAQKISEWIWTQGDKLKEKQRDPRTIQFAIGKAKDYIHALEKQVAHKRKKILSALNSRKADRERFSSYIWGTST